MRCYFGLPLSYPICASAVSLVTFCFYWFFTCWCLNWLSLPQSCKLWVLLTSLLGMASKRNVGYNRLPTDEDFYDSNARQPDPRFDYSPKSFDKIPWKSIALALFLLVLGSTLLFLSYFIFTGHMGGELSQAYGLFALGILTFLPGTMELFSFSFFISMYY